MHSLNNVVLPRSVVCLLVNITDNAYAVSVVACVKTLPSLRRQIHFPTFLLRLKGTVRENKLEMEFFSSEKPCRLELGATLQARDSATSTWCAFYADVVQFGTHLYRLYMRRT